MLAACAAGIDASQAEEVRCYPGPPLYVLRELMGGVDSAERYQDAVLTYARKSCRNDQTLKLVSPAGPDEKDKLNGRIAAMLCEPETIYRETLAPGEGALVLFCLISKLDDSHGAK